LGPKDRQALLARLLDRLHRGEPYVHVLPLGRSREGRRDDVLLVSALTNSELLSPWLAPLLEREIPLAGIWSLPLLSAKLLPACHANEDNVLLLSQQIRTAHRETYFNKGQLLFSRQAKLERGLRDAFEVAHRAQAISKSSEQIRIFLTNQRTMGFADKLHVYCLLPEDSVAPLSALTPDSAGISYHPVPLGRLYAHFKLPQEIVPKEDVLFSYLCASAPLAPDHYATPVQKKFFRRLRLDKYLARAGVLACVLALAAAGVLWLYSLDLDQQRQQLITQRQVLERRYQLDFAPRQAALDQAASVQNAVELMRRLEQEALQSPDQLMAPLSYVFSDTRFAVLQLDSLSWKKYPPGALAQLVAQTQASVSAASATADSQEQAQPEESAEALQASAIVAGYLRRGDMSYRQTVALMTQFAEALRQRPEIAAAVTVKMPVDVRPPLTFVDDSGADRGAVNPQQEQENNRFEILLALALPAPLVPLDTPAQPGDASTEAVDASSEAVDASGEAVDTRSEDPNARPLTSAAGAADGGDLAQQNHATAASLPIKASP
ncbi:MAG TPA: hypothetical protein PKC70_07520, partial [Cellvibrionaceae bacterium]|nr:hypothetical protein [Cellvibrionaceae bacterium]